MYSTLKKLNALIDSHLVSLYVLEKKNWGVYILYLFALAPICKIVDQIPLLIASSAHAERPSCLACLHSWPIRTPHPTCTNQDAWAFVTHWNMHASHSMSHKVVFLLLSFLKSVRTQLNKLLYIWLSLSSVLFSCRRATNLMQIYCTFIQIK